MAVKTVSKYNRISARKTRIVADMVRGQKVEEAFQVLRFTPKKAAKLIFKTLRSAVANAEHNAHLDKDGLVISEIMVDEGPTHKRFRPRAQGRAGRINKRTAHVTIVLEGEVLKPKAKVEERKTVEKKPVKSEKVSQTKEKK